MSPRTNTDDRGRPKMVRLYNASDTVFRNWHDGRIIELAPGESLIVNWDHAAGWLGDPTLRDTERYRARTQEWMRLRVMYGVYESENTDLLPNLEVWFPVEEPDHTRQQRIPMILDDPNGHRIPKFAIVAEPVTADDRIAALERELRALIAEQKGSGVGAADGGAPTSSNRRKGPKPEAEPVDSLDELDADEPVRPGVG